VVARFEGRLFRVPSRVLSAPAILYPGLDWKRVDLRGALVRLGYREARVMRVEPGRTVSLAIELPQGTLALNATPWAEVWVDGQRVGDTPIGNLAVTIGPHEVIFRHPELGERRHAITVTTNLPGRLSVDLRVP